MDGNMGSLEHPAFPSSSAVLPGSRSKLQFGFTRLAFESAEPMVSKLQSIFQLSNVSA
jgi:hypothetical protein